MTMSEQAGFLRAIIEQPDDDVHRLVFADWLEDNGQGEWAALIRVQCAQQRLMVPWNDPYTDPGLLPLRCLNDRTRGQVLGGLDGLFTEQDLHDGPSFNARFRAKLRRGLIEYLEVCAE